MPTFEYSNKYLLKKAMAHIRPLLLQSYYLDPEREAWVLGNGFLGYHRIATFKPNRKIIILHDESNKMFVESLAREMEKFYLESYKTKTKIKIRLV